jgi:hypothetical protein
MLFQEASKEKKLIKKKIWKNVSNGQAVQHATIFK